ncbi:MAG: transcriptional regulator [Candidatus Competibacter denitrificans]|jgi:putative transcriptional regulator
MTQPTETISPILAAVHETAAELYAANLIDQTRLQKYEALCLPPIPAYSGEDIRALRHRYHLSETMLATVLNTRTSTVRQWEIGNKRPDGPLLKLLNLLDRKGLDALI